MSSADTHNDLAEFVATLGGGDGLRVEETLGNGFVRLRVAEAERRQAKHDIRCVEDAVIELLRNARDAHASRIYVASSKERDVRTITIVDDGDGIPAHMHARVFDARVTSKLDTMLMDAWGVHGRGMALYSIRENSLSARVMDSDVGRGCALRVTFDTTTIVERADQSSWPTVARKNGDIEVRGPRNIARACVEFGYQTDRLCNVYLGSPSEICATIRARTRLNAQAVRAFAQNDFATLSVVERIALARDAKELQAVAERAGMLMSERTAHRIVREQIQPLKNVCAQEQKPTSYQNGRPSSQDTRPLALTNDDRAEFLDALSSDFQRLAERYYVTIVGTPRLSMGKGTVHVTFEYVDDD